MARADGAGSVADAALGGAMKMGDSWNVDRMGIFSTNSRDVPSREGMKCVLGSPVARADARISRRI
jgi:hypothetical protein